MGRLVWSCKHRVAERPQQHYGHQHQQRSEPRPRNRGVFTHRAQSRTSTCSSDVMHLRHSLQREHASTQITLLHSSVRLILVRSRSNIPRRHGRTNRLIDSVSKPFVRPLGWLWSKGFRFLFVIDAIVLFFTMIVINICRFGTSWPTYPLSHYFVGFTIATTIQILINYFSGLYERESDIGTRPWLPRVSLAIAIGIATDGLVSLITDRYLMPRLNLVALFLTSSITLSSTRYLSRVMARGRRGPARLGLIGSSAECARVRHIIESDGSSIVVLESRSMAEITDPVLQSNLTDVLILDLETMAETRSDQFVRFSESGIGLHQRISSLETMLGLRAVRQISGIPVTRLHTKALSSHQSRLKRTLDIIIIITASPLYSLALLLTAMYVRISAGPGILYSQNRVGYLGQTFRILKFRTMVNDAESSSGPKLSHANDSRVIPSLRWLRASRLDELPQIWNVFRGEMSIVGPRPERPEFVEKIVQNVPGYDRRHGVKPGMTGLAQVHGRYDSDPVHKLGYDLQYLANWSLILDLQIILSTSLALLRPLHPSKDSSKTTQVSDEKPK